MRTLLRVSDIVDLVGPNRALAIFGIKLVGAPAMWVQSRQYTGRIATVSDARLFDEPVYNYTRDFPFLWEEQRISVPYGSDTEAAERILLDSAARHGVEPGDLGEAAVREMQRRYFMVQPDTAPRVCWRLTGDGIEMALRFIAQEHGTREQKDAMSRDILRSFQRHGIRIASQSMEISGSLASPSSPTK